MATSKGVTQSALSVTAFPAKPEDAFVAIILKDDKAGTSTGFVNKRLSINEFLTSIKSLFPALKEEIEKELKKAIADTKGELIDQMDGEMGALSMSVEGQVSGLHDTMSAQANSTAGMLTGLNNGLTQLNRALTAGDAANATKIDGHIADFDKFVLATNQKLDNLGTNTDEKLTAIEKSAKSYTDTQLESLKNSGGTGNVPSATHADVGSNVDGYVMSKDGWKPVRATQFKNMLSEIGITYDVRLGRWFLDEGELEETDPDNAGGLNANEQAKKDRDDADKSDDPALNPNKIATGGTGEKGQKDDNGNLIHDSSGGNISMGANDKNNPGSDNADPTSATYGKLYNNGKATDAKAPYADVDAPVTRLNTIPSLGSQEGTPYAYLDSLTSTRTSTVITDGNLEIAMCPVVKGADPIEANASGYPIKMASKTRWQFFLSLALADTTNGSAILSLYPTITYRLSDGTGKFITFELKRQGKRYVLFDKASGTTIYAGYQESDESTVQFLIRPELFTSTFAPYKINDAGSLLGLYYADVTAEYIAGNKMQQRIQVNATSDGSFKDKVVYRPVNGRPDDSLFVKATDGASKGNTVFAYSSDSPRTFYLNVLDHTKTPIDLSGTFLTARSDDVYLSLGVLTNVGQRLDNTKPATLATPNRNGGYDIVVPPAKDNEKNGLYLAVIMYRKNIDGTLTAYSDASAEAPRVAFRFMETTESNSYGGIFLSTYGSNTGGGAYKNKYDGSLGFDYKVGFPSRSYYLGGGVVSRDKLFGNNMANNGSANPLSGPSQIIFNLGLTGYTSKPETFPGNVPLKPYKTTAKNGGAITEHVYSGSFILQATLEDMKTRNIVNFDVPINISVQGE